MRTDPAEWRPRDIDDLEPAAWDALRANTSSVTAGPGAGKSEFLAQRASYLLETGICRPPQQILAISFKRDAAANLRRRVWGRIPEHADRFTSMTFDAFTKSLVDRFKDLLPVTWAMKRPYRVGFSSVREVRDFLDNLAASADPGLQSALNAIKGGTFISDMVGPTQLPSELGATTTPAEYAVLSWWAQKYLAHEVPTVDFVMLNRLAELLIRTNPQLRRALLATYPYVFVDEFQDTTYTQYSFLHSVFGGSQTIVTVVGDRKQRIMGWAGALDDAFSQFEHDFSASPFELNWNFRSTQQLVDLQHRFAELLHPQAQRQISQVPATLGESPTAIWSFSTTTLEADTLAAWIAADIEQSGRPASKYALIARQKVADLEPALASSLAKQQLKLRNDDALIGKVRLQDLLKDELIRLLVGLIRLGASRGGQPGAWRDVVGILAQFIPEELNREVGSRADDSLAAFLVQLRSWFAARFLDNHIVASPTPERVKELTDDLTDLLTEFVQLDDLAHKRVFTDRPEDLDITLDAFKLRLGAVIADADAWDQVAGAFIEEDAVPLLTIHRSKGLEYHTVFFVGLDGDQWWAHARETIDSTMAFFVGVSRAAERLIFTQCDQRGSQSPIQDIYDELARGGVPLVRIG
ncbi:MAG: ATP-dependent helicase [Actinomycetia bacterium]|nr:ATP-dependent helicase [Actinomycetes bacterium]